jgi:hypothetical protein
LIEIEVAVDKYFTQIEGYEQSLSAEQLSQPFLLDKPLPFSWRQKSIDHNSTDLNDLESPAIPIGNVRYLYLKLFLLNLNITDTTAAFTSCTAAIYQSKLRGCTSNLPTHGIRSTQTAHRIR